MLVHEEYDTTPCPICGDEDQPEPECWHCKGSGLMDPDGVVSCAGESEEAEPDPGRQWVECPRCGALMARIRESDGSIFCRRCDGFTTPLDGEDVLRDPRILEG